jgi:hypothetical protein
MDTLATDMDTLAAELHKPARRIYPRRRTKALGVDDLWQIDLVEMIPYSDENDGYKYLLTQIDVYSKFARVEPVKSKSMVDVTAAFEKMLGSSPVRHLQSDEGKEFFNKKFAALTKRRGINHYHTFSSTKASVVERFNRTLKTAMWKEFTRQGSYQWLHLVPTLLDRYNGSVHRTIRARPVDVMKNKQSPAKQKKIVAKAAKLKVGDKVRVSHSKATFDKGYQQNWTNEVFTVAEVSKTRPITYKLTEYSGVPRKGCFYEQEVQKTRVPDLFLVEKVLKEKKVGKKTTYLVRWKGYSEKYDSWVDNLDALR